ncbi:MAG: alpha/beta hydrolase family protein [Acidimicrobiales bacterium]
MPRHLLLSLALAVTLLGAACSDSEGDDTQDSAATAGQAVTTTDVAVATTTSVAPVPEAEAADFSGRGPYSVGQVDLQLDADHVVAVFYPVDPDAVTPDAEAYSYSGVDILDPAISAILPGSLSGEVSPADTWVGLPASDDGPFPTVLHSHGFSGNARFGNQHNAAVASWGYVVAAVDHPERGLRSILDGFLAGDASETERPDEFLDSDQLIAALDLLADSNEAAESPLLGVVDTDRVAAEGHSAGGSASGTAAYDERVAVWIGQAPGTPLPPDADLDAFAEQVEEDGETRSRLDVAALLEASQPPEVPSMIIAAAGDTVVELERVEQTYAWLNSPKRLAVIADSGHAVFVDPCVPIREEGGLGVFMEGLGLDPDTVPLVELGENGCLPSDTDPELVWGLIDHLTVAQLNEVFEIDTEVATASLDPDYLDVTFPGLLREIVTG